MEYREQLSRSASGTLELFARDYPGEGTPLLLMHGLTRNSADFEPLADHLAGRHRMIVPDIRGRGRSQFDPDPANYRPDVYAADMFALMDSLAVPRVRTIGTSMGGLVSMAMATMQPDRVEAMVLNDIGPHIEPAGLARIAEHVGQVMAATAVTFANWDEAAAASRAANGSAFPELDHAGWISFARRTCRETPDGIALAYDPAIAQTTASPAEGEIDLWPLWDTLTAIPVLTIRGGTSDLLSRATVEEMARRHKAPFASVEIPRRGHAPLLDEPEATAAIDSFLASLP